MLEEEDNGEDSMDEGDERPKRRNWTFGGSAHSGGRKSESDIDDSDAYGMGIVGTCPT